MLDFKFLIDNVNDVRKSLNEISVYDLKTRTSMELYYNIANKVNEIINELSRFEGVISDEVIEQNKILSYLLEEGLNSEVIKKIDKMISNGTFDKIINTNIFSDLNSQIKEKADLTIVNDVVAKANNPIGSMQTNGQKIPYSLLDDQTIQAIVGTTNIVTNAGYEKNKGVDYPLKQIARDGIISSSSDKIKNGILDIKIKGAKIGKYYRVEWIGNGVELNGARYDICISEYEKDIYTTDSNSNKINLITIDDLLGKDNPPKETTITTRLFTSLRENISIEITYDRSVIGSSLALNNNSGAGYSFIIDESCYEYTENDLPTFNPPMYVRKRGDEITFAWKYDSNYDMNLFINRFSANKLMLFGFIGLKANTSNYVSKRIGEPNSASLTQICPQLTDSISPYIMKAVNNPDGDKANSTYDFVGGCHNYDNLSDDTATATARLVKYELLVDGRIINKDGVYSCSNAKLICTNRIQANNTKKADGTGREVLEEKVTYEITPSNVKVSNEMTALEDIIIQRNYGLQAYISGYTSNNGFINYINGKQYSPYSLPTGGNSGNATDGVLNCRAIEVYNNNYYMKVEMDDIGLTYKREILDGDNLAFFSNNKIYFFLINKSVNLTKDSRLFYSGKYYLSPKN